MAIPMMKEEYVQEEPGYAVRQSIWESEDGSANVVNNISSGWVTIIWSTSF